MEKILRIGIIGLGRRWQKRYKPALLGLRTAFTISAVCDQVQERAAREAKRLACTAAAGPTQLLEREDVEAILLVDEQWFGLWPLVRACQLGKPVLCCCSLAADDLQADALHRQVSESRSPVMMEMLPRFATATAQLRSLFTTVLGAPRLLCCEVSHFGRVPRAPTPARRPVLDLAGGGIGLLDWCAGLLGGEPLNVVARTLEGGGFSTLFLEFADRRGVQLTRRCHAPTAAGTIPIQKGLRRAAAGLEQTDRSRVRLQVLAERGSAVAELPAQVSWITQTAIESHSSRGELSSTQLLLVYFREVVQERAALQATFADAYRVLRWLRVAVKSRDEGRLLSIPG